MPSSQDFKDAVNRAIEGVDQQIEETDPQDIRIEAPREPEVKPEVWKDVESMIYRGFITLSGDINGVEFLFKSLNHHEFEFVQWLANGGSTSTDRFYNTFLAYGVFMIDGQNILPTRTQWISELVKLFSELPQSAKTKLVRYLSEVNRRATNAVTITEAYVMEQSSRFRWAQLQGLDLMSPTCTGVPGTEVLGLNYAQLVWRALNVFEDIRDTAEREWDNAKFIGSCFAGKEIQKIYNQDKDRRRKEKEQRVERRDKLLRQVLLGERPDGPEQGRQIKIVARTVEELAKQLESDLRGEKDWHDLVVEAEERRMHDQIRQRREKINDMVRERARVDGGREVSAQTLIAEGLTPQEVQQRITRRKQLEAQKAASRMVFPEMNDPRLENFLSKYGGPSEGTYETPVKQTDRDPSAALPVAPMTRPKPTPFKR